MQPAERLYVLLHLASTEDRLLALTDGLTPAQWTFHESPDRWSIAENLEHVILVEQLITQGVAHSLGQPAQPEKMAAAPPKDALVSSVSHPKARAMHLSALEAVTPTGRYASPEAMIAEFRKLRAESVRFATDTQADLRSHFFAHQLLGDLDCYQWLVVQAQHGGRHALQIEDIKADPNYPQT